jgi:hypothetical protein
MNSGIDFSQIPLRDIHLPGAVTWWPPAVGWWIVLVCVLAVVALWGLRYYRHYRRRVALKVLGRVLAALEQGAEPVTCLQQVSSVLRRFAMSIATDRSAVAGLVGSRWLRYLDSRWDRDLFANGPGGALVVAPYAPADSLSREDAVALTTLCIDWVRTQKPAE